MTEIEMDLCGICGEPATHYFGNAGTLPVCENVVCQQATLDKINAALQLAAQEEEEQ